MCARFSEAFRKLLMTYNSRTQGPREYNSSSRDRGGGSVRGRAAGTERFPLNARGTQRQNNNKRLRCLLDRSKAKRLPININRYNLSLMKHIPTAVPQHLRSRTKLSLVARRSANPSKLPSQSDGSTVAFHFPRASGVHMFGVSKQTTPVQ